jgi:hypothetical protein
MHYGGTPPRRVDQGQGSPPPGLLPPPSSLRVFARQLIIYGGGSGVPAGSFGLFEYIGQPGPGNPPVFWIAPPQVTADPYGNPLPTSGGAVSEAQGGGLLIQMNAGVLSFDDTLSAEVLTQLGEMLLIHAGSTASSPILAINSPAADANATHSSLWMTGYSQAGGTTPVQVSLFAGYGNFTPVAVQFIVCGTITYGTIAGGVPTPETWHDLAPSLAGWASRAGAYPLQYRLLASPPNTVQLQGDVTGGALAAGTITLATLPAGYYPIGFATPAMPIVSSGRTVATDVPDLVVTTAGVLQIRNAQGATDLQFNCQFPLDGNTS